MDLREIISTYKKKTGASDADIAARTGVSRSTVTRWSSGTVRRISGETMRRVSEMVGFNIEPVMKGMNINVRLPVLGYVKAGYDLFAEENYLGEEEASIEDAAKGDYYLKVTGDSMNGVGILDGSLVLVRQCTDVDSGKIAVVLVGDEVTVKRVVKKERMMILEAANPEVQSRYLTAQQVRDIPVTILGQVISAKTYY
jgi:repressor LexA